MVFTSLLPIIINLILKCRYKYLSECGQEIIEETKSNLAKCDWNYNIGEAVLDINVIDDVINKESSILVLGERNIFCLNANGKMLFMKKFDFSPICFHVYPLGSKKIN